MNNYKVSFDGLWLIKYEPRWRGTIFRACKENRNKTAVGALQIDNLNYSYYEEKPNQLKTVTDASGITLGFKDGTNTETDYLYDDYGNMTSDANKGIVEINYNHLNLPVSIHFENGGIISYLYTATGQKVQKNVLSSTEYVMTDYLTGFQYHNTYLKNFPTAEGYVQVLGEP